MRISDWSSDVCSSDLLSFPMVQPDLIEAISENSDDGEVLLGDIVLAHGVCTREAAEKNLSTEDHAAHLIVHGTLHLLGYDHVDDLQAEAMEEIERQAMADLGLADPYPVREDEGETHKPSYRTPRHAALWRAIGKASSR